MEPSFWNQVKFMYHDLEMQFRGWMLELKGLDKIRAEKDIMKVRNSLVNINKTAPIILNQMNELASKLSN